jgi:uncharacterized protein (DUF4415 family)
MPRRRPDDAPLTKKELAALQPLRDVFPDLAEFARHRARKGEPVKQAVSIRLPANVIAFFQSKGPGWQTRISNTLQAIVDANQ